MTRTWNEILLAESTEREGCATDHDVQDSLNASWEGSGNAFWEGYEIVVSEGYGSVSLGEYGNAASEGCEIAVWEGCGIASVEGCGNAFVLGYVNDVVAGCETVAVDSTVALVTASGLSCWFSWSGMEIWNETFYGSDPWNGNMTCVYDDHAT